MLEFFLLRILHYGFCLRVFFYRYTLLVPVDGLISPAGTLIVCGELRAHRARVVGVETLQSARHAKMVATAQGRAESKIRSLADLVVKEGDLVICDATVAGPGGYYSDFARTFSRGAPKPETKQRYKEAYHSLHEALKLVKPGSCAAAFKHFGKGATARLPGFDGFHGVGLCIYESPWLRGGDPEPTKHRSNVIPA